MCTWIEGVVRLGLAHYPCPQLADSRLHQAGPEQVSWNAVVLMGVRSSRKLAGAGGSGEHLCCSAPDFPGLRSPDVELLLCIWLAHWEPCKLRQTRIKLGRRMHRSSILITVGFNIHYKVSGKRAEASILFKLLQLPEIMLSILRMVKWALADCLYFSTATSSPDPHIETWKFTRPSGEAFQGSTGPCGRITYCWNLCTWRGRWSLPLPVPRSHQKWETLFQRQLFRHW